MSEYNARNPYLRTDGRFIVGVPKYEFRRGRLYGFRFVVASLVRDKGPMTMPMIARELGTETSLVSGRVTDLRKMGYLRPTGRLIRSPWCMKRSVEYEFVTNPRPIKVEAYTDENESDIREVIEHFRKRIRNNSHDKPIYFYGWEVAMLLERIERRLRALGLKHKRGRMTLGRATDG